MAGRVVALTRRADIVIVGGGVAAIQMVRSLAEKKFSGTLLVVADTDQWQGALPPSFRLGQSREKLTWFPKAEFHDPKGFMTVSEHMHENVSVAVQAAEAFRAENVDGEETSVLRVTRNGAAYFLQCANGMVIETNFVFMATGVGPEKTLEQSGVVYESPVSDKRKSFREVLTVLDALKLDKEFWRDKDVTVYGGGATAAFFMEFLMYLGIPLGKLTWLGADFKTANPGGRNTATMEWAKPMQKIGTMKSVKFLGGDAPTQGSGLSYKTEGSPDSTGTGVIVCATGSNPLATFGIETVLGSLFKELRPVAGANGGVFAKTDDSKLYVASAAMAHVPDFAKLIRAATFPSLDPQNHVTAGALVARLSAHDAAEDGLAKSKH